MHRVLRAHWAVKERVFPTVEPRPSYRLISALRFYSQALDQVDALREQDRQKQREQEARERR